MIIINLINYRFPAISQKVRTNFPPNSSGKSAKLYSPCLAIRQCFDKTEKGKMSGRTRKKIQKKLKIRGYSLKTDGLDEILSFVNRFQDAEDEAIDLLLDQLDHHSCNFFCFFFLGFSFFFF